MPKIQFKRGTEANVPKLATGEPAFTTDTEKLFIGGASGNVEVAKQETVTEVQNSLQSQINTVGNETAEAHKRLDDLQLVDANAEVLAARGGEATLGNRLDKVSSDLAEIAKQKYFYPSAKHYLSQMNFALKSDSAVTTSNTKGAYILNMLSDSLFGYLRRPMVKFIKNYYGLNGLGFSAFNSFGNYETTTMSGITQLSVSNTNLTDDEFGFCGGVLKGSAGATIAYTTTSDFPFNDFRLFFLKRNGGGQFQYNVDGGAWTAVDTNNATSVIGSVEVNNINNMSGQSAAIHKPHTINIQITSGEVWLYGIQTFNNETRGILLNFISAGGTRSSQWDNAKKLSYLQQFLNITTPDQLHVWFGTNDAGTDLSPASEYYTHMSNIINGITLQSLTDIVLYTHMQRGLSTDFSLPDDTVNNLLSQYRDKLFQIAKEKSVSLFDVSSIMPARTLGWNSGFFGDIVHPSNDGAGYLSMYITSFILPKAPNHLASLHSSNVFRGTTQSFMENTMLTNAYENSNGDIVQRTTDGISFDSNGAVHYKNNNKDRIIFGNYPIIDLYPDSGSKKIFSSTRTDNSNGAFDMTMNGADITFNTWSGGVQYFARLGTNYLWFDGNNVNVAKPVKQPTYTKSTLPSVSYTGVIIVVTDGNTDNSSCVAYSNGTNWKRVKDDSIIS